MTFAEIAAALPKNAVTSIDGLPFPRIASGKVRVIFDLGDALLLVATDRLSAFDIILPDGIPGKGAILTQMSLWWFDQTRGLIQNHLLPDQAGEFARRGITDADLRLRSMIVRKLKPLTIGQMRGAAAISSAAAGAPTKKPARFAASGFRRGFARPTGWRREGRSSRQRPRLRRASTMSRSTTHGARRRSAPSCTRR